MKKCSDASDPPEVGGLVAYAFLAAAVAAFGLLIYVAMSWAPSYRDILVQLGAKLSPLTVFAVGLSGVIAQWLLVIVIVMGVSVVLGIRMVRSSGATLVAIGAGVILACSLVSSLVIYLGISSPIEELKTSRLSAQPQEAGGPVVSDVPASVISNAVTAFCKSGDLKYFDVGESILYTFRPYLDSISPGRRQSIIDSVKGKQGKSQEFANNVVAKYELVKIDSERISGSRADCLVRLKRRADGVEFPMICRLMQSDAQWKIIAFDANLPQKEIDEHNKRTLENALAIERAIGEDNMPKFIEDVLVNGLSIEEALQKYRR